MNMTGYVEADFLGAGITSNNNQSNSYVLRQRQVWGQAALHNGWTFTGGQMWSLVTETKARRGQPYRSVAHDHRPAIYRGLQLGASVWLPRRQELQQQGVGRLLGGELAGDAHHARQHCQLLPARFAGQLAAACTMPPSTAAPPASTPAGAPVTTAAPISRITRSTRRRTSSENWPFSRASDTMKSSVSPANSAIASSPMPARLRLARRAPTTARRGAVAAAATLAGPCSRSMLTSAFTPWLATA